MKRWITGIVWLLGVAMLPGQNLVPNPGFEQFESCPKSYTSRAPGTLVPGWEMPSRGTPDYYHSCSRFNVGVPMNMMGNCFPAEGKAYAGMILLENPGKMEEGKRPLDYREYLRCALEEPLEAGKKYRVGCAFAVAGHSMYLAPRLGLHLSDEPVKKRKGVIGVEPNVLMDSTRFDYEQETWYSLSDTITARGGEKHLLIGNFFDDRHTPYRERRLSDYPGYRKRSIEEIAVAYLFIDEVEVRLIE